VLRDRTAICQKLLTGATYLENTGVTSEGEYFHLGPGTSETDAGRLTKALTHYAVFHGAKVVDDDLFK
jgi:hypothetical protein